MNALVDAIRRARTMINAQPIPKSVARRYAEHIASYDLRLFGSDEWIAPEIQEMLENARLMHCCEDSTDA